MNYSAVLHDQKEAAAAREGLPFVWPPRNDQR
jgi:hypothetical protein